MILDMEHTANLMFAQKWAHKPYVRRREGIFGKLICFQNTDISISYMKLGWKVAITLYFLFLFLFELNPFLCNKSIAVFQCTVIVFPKPLPQAIVSSFVHPCRIVDTVGSCRPQSQQYDNE
jgi:hypothetical protein